MSELRIFATDFHPDHTLDCGQCFRWNKEPDNSYTGIVSGRIVNLTFLPDQADNTDNADEADELGKAAKPKSSILHGTIVLNNADETDLDFWTNYFDLNTDYGHIKQSLSEADPIVARAIEFGGGMRILRQEPWETLVSFILSANNNIPRIKKCVESLAYHFGEEAGTYKGKTYHNLPTPDALAALSPEELDICKLGYRAKYLISTANEIKYRGIETLEDCIHSLSGVGPKVANCILLFSLARLHRFPIDVWVRKVMHELYGFDEKDTKAMTAFADLVFGPYAGIAQQYLFYYMRSLK
jgi:N-glycosylase/DNA lyase